MRIHIKTYGCQMNERESDAAYALLASCGHSTAQGEFDADVIILNTCSVRDQSERKAIGKLGILKRLKRERPAILLGVMGCMAQSRGEELLKDIPHLDFVIGTDQLHALPETLDELAASKARVAKTGSDGKAGQADGSRTSSDNAFSEYISVMRGCNRFCSYCIVPFVRGRERSRPQEEIVEEARLLAASGIKEITLLGQNIAAYGLDGRTPPLDDNVSPFAELLERLDGIEGLRRIRFTSPHPAFFNSRLIETLGGLRKGCDCVHLPLQSGSDRILKLMNRPYSAVEYLAITERLLKLVPSMLFSTDVIVGFPGETEEDFEATRSLMEKVAFDNAFIFKYSPRRGTKAAGLPDDIPMELKERRNQLLLEDMERRVEQRNMELVGKTLEVLAEGPSKRNPKRWSGRTSSNKLAVFDPPTGIRPGELLNVRICSSTSMTLFGELASS